MTNISLPTYLEFGCGSGPLSVALIQWDDGDNVLSIRLQAGQSIELNVTSNLHSLHAATLVEKQSINILQMEDFKEKYYQEKKCL